MSELEGKVAIVSGAARGQGRAIIRRLAGAGLGSLPATSAPMTWRRCATSSETGSWPARGLTKVAALELAAYGIRVNAVGPGPIATHMVLRDDDPAARERLSRTPLGRIGEPEDVAEAVLFLVSARSSFITGAESPSSAGRPSGPCSPSRGVRRRRLRHDRCGALPPLAVRPESLSRWAHDAQRVGSATNAIVPTSAVRGWSTLPVTVA